MWFNTLIMANIMFCWCVFSLDRFPAEAWPFSNLKSLYMEPAQLQNICFLWSGTGTKPKTIAKAMVLPAFKLSANTHILAFWHPTLEKTSSSGFLSGFSWVTQDLSYTMPRWTSSAPGLHVTRTCLTSSASRFEATNTPHHPWRSTPCWKPPTHCSAATLLGAEQTACRLIKGHNKAGDEATTEE